MEELSKKNDYNNLQYTVISSGEEFEFEIRSFNLY